MSEQNPYDNNSQDSTPPASTRSGGFDAGPGAPVARSGGGAGGAVLVLLGFLLFAGMGLFLVFKLFGGSGSSSSADSESRDKRKTEQTTKKQTDPATSDPEEIEPKSESGGSSLEGEISYVTPLRLRSGTVYFLGIYKNTTDRTIRRPRITLHLLGDSGDSLRTYRGYGLRGPLGPGEKTAVRILVQRPPEYSRYRFEHVAKEPYVKRERPRLKITGQRVAKRKYFGYRATGTIRNVDEVDAKWVQVQVILYGKDNKLAGIGSTYVKPRTLEPGETARFRIMVFPSKGEVMRSEFLSTGRVQR